jgi:hypothetical protein
MITKQGNLIYKIINEELDNFSHENQNNLNDNFWKWFGNSVVIENNTPIIVYHATKTNFKSSRQKNNLRNNIV